MSNEPSTTILIVDDVEASRYTLCRMLQKARFVVREAGSCQEALRLASEKPDLIILDVNLPDGSGYDVCKQIKADPATTAIPVLHLSASFVDADNRAAGLEQQRLLISRNGTERPIDESAAPIRDSQGHFLGVVLVFRDVTERQRIEEKLQDADRRKDEFLATLAHELRNPLAPIRHGLQVLRLSGTENGMVAEARSMMERQLSQMVRLVDDLLDVSRITRDKLDLRRQRVALAAVVHS